MLKKTLSTITFMFLTSFVSYSQFINKKHIKDYNLEYLQVNFTTTGRQENIVIYTEQDAEGFKLRDENGKKIKFKSIPQILRYFKTYDYELFYAYSLRDIDDLYYIILKYKGQKK